MSRTVSAKNRFLWLGLLFSCIAFMHAVTAFAGTITLAWDASTTNTDGTPLTDLAGYKIYYGPTSGSYTNTLDVGDVTTSEVSKLTDGLAYSFAVTAYNSAGVESSFSNEVSKTPPPAQLTLTTFMITATADIGGTITPAGTTGVNYGANQTITIAPSAGYHVATVLVDGVSKGAVTTYTFTSVTANHTIAASFAINSYPITASAGTGGSISPSGAVSANFSGNAIFSITPNAGYSTTDVKVDGVSNGAVTTYTFTNVTAAHTIAATFAQTPPSTITASAANSDNSLPVHGSISSAGTTTVNKGDSLTITISPDPQYEVYSVLVDGTQRGAITSYTFNSITQSHTITAYFRLITYTVTAASDVHGTVSPAGTRVLNIGSSGTYTITPKPGYHTADVLVDGVSIGAVVTYTFDAIAANHTIAATFAENPSYTITSPDDLQVLGLHGSISPSGISTVLGGTDKLFTIVADAGYRVLDVLVDGSSVGAVASYTFRNIQANHTISSTYEPDLYTITSTAANADNSVPAHGTITPLGTITVNKGASLTYLITPDPGYQVSSVIVNGTQNRGAITTYTFNNITANSTIDVYFK